MTFFPPKTYKVTQTHKNWMFCCCTKMGNSKSSSGTDTFDLPSLCSGLDAGAFKHVVVMCGAGVSTAAGVPDFRSPSAGLYFKVFKRTFFTFLRLPFLEYWQSVN